MLSKVLFVLLILMVACGREYVPVTVFHTDTVLVVDSACRDTLHTERVLASLTKQQMLRYAGIVNRDPSQSKFILGWTRRAFAR